MTNLRGYLHWRSLRQNVSANSKRIPLLHKQWQDVYKAITKESMLDSMNVIEVHNRDDMYIEKLNKDKRGKAL
jgi:hypothetical protein